MNTSHSKGFNATFNDPSIRYRETPPVLKEKTAHSPVHSSPMTSSKYSTQAGETCPESSELVTIWNALFVEGTGQLPWQLKMPMTPVHLFKFHIFRRLFPSVTGSVNKQSRDGLPGYLALSTDPSGSTSLCSILKSCRPGLSLLIKRLHAYIHAINKMWSGSVVCIFICEPKTETWGREASRNIVMLSLNSQGHIPKHVDWFSYDPCLEQMEQYWKIIGGYVCWLSFLLSASSYHLQHVLYTCIAN